MNALYNVIENVQISQVIDVEFDYNLDAPEMFALCFKKIKSMSL